MGHSQTTTVSTPPVATIEPEKPKKLGPCCVCKETKKLRDECIVTKS